MSAILNSLMVPSGDTVFHSVEFLRFVHDHENYLKASSVLTNLDPSIVYQCEYNFMSLLVQLKYPIENIMMFMVVNDIDDPIQLTKEFVQMKLPDTGVMEQLKSLFLLASGRV